MHSVRGFSCLIAVTACLCFFSPGYAGPGFPQEYSADVVSRAGGQTMQSKIYVSGQKMRTEMAAGAVMIVRFDKNISLVLMPKEKMYMEQAINRKMLHRTSREFEGEVERLSMGKESVDGAQAEKFKVTYTEGARRMEAYQWVTDAGFPVKMEAVDGSWSVWYKNVSFSPQPADLFEPPPGYQKFAMPVIGDSGLPALDDLMSKVKADQ